MKLKKSKNYENVYSYETQKGIVWAVRFNYYDLDGQRREKQIRGIRTEKLAHKAELALEVKYVNNDIQQIMDSSMTVTQWIQQFVDLNIDHWRPATKILYHNCFNRYVIPLIGEQQLDHLTRPKYQRMFIKPLLKKLAPVTVANHHRIVMVLINSAVENDVLAKNKLRGIKIPKGEPRKAFSPDDLAKFNAYLPRLKPEFQTIFTLLELTGMRLGESLALTWADIDFKGKTIHITKSRNALGTGPTKTAAGIRKISMPASLIKALKHYELVQKKMCLHSKLTFDVKHLVFTSITHNTPASTAGVGFNFHKALEGAGIDSKKYVVHCLRHTHATYLLNSGINPADVAKRLGHSNANVTLGIYAHSLDQNDAAIAVKIDQIIAI
ncbi:tyrosine-type recombinase/integrase [Lactiplantibacillus carotarum]|uniref:tyrosine-type recombinase/integrase n=1 Tax=Lactiplantibacillus carotarum TaxID=2993456 RepID=UPI00298F123B|nr:tyrosine-type recombinase/integrase [Lactiplantibacillus carotarum]